MLSWGVAIQVEGCSPEIADAAGCAQASGGSFVVTVGTVFEEVQQELIGWVNGQLATLPTCPGIDRHAQGAGHLSLGEIQQCPQVARVRMQVRPRTRRPVAQSDGHVC